MATGRRNTWWICIGIIAAAAGCTYKKEVAEVPCTIPATVTYTAQVQPILGANCYSCHSAASLGSGIRLDSYAALKAYALNGQLYGAVAHLPGFRPMPDGGGMLDACTIATIKAWIDNGTPEN